MPRSSASSLSLLVSAAGWTYLVTSFVARLPAAMLPLGLLLFEQRLTGSFAVGSLVLAGLSVGGACGGPAVGALADRWGPRRTLFCLTLLSAALLSLLLWSSGVAAARSHAVTMVALAALLGASNGQVGALSRARWSARFAGSRDRHWQVSTAMAYEGAMDEVSFVVGPAVVASLVGWMAPVRALGLVLALLVVGQLVFSRFLSRTPQAHRSAGRFETSLPVLMVWLAVGVCVGAVFGSVQTGVAGRLTASGQAGLIGFVYAGVGLGSAVSGIVVAHLALGSLVQRAAIGGLGVALSAALFAFWSGAASNTGICLLVGVFVAPMLVTSYTAVERLGSAGSTWNLTLLATATVVGVAVGAMGAGFAVDLTSPTVALLIPCGAGVLAAGAVATLGWRRGL